jgi:hypothetical protein
MRSRVADRLVISGFVAREWKEWIVRLENDHKECWKIKEKIVVARRINETGMSIVDGRVLVKAGRQANDNNTKDPRSSPAKPTLLM